MEARVARELLHSERRLGIAASIVARGRDAHEADDVAQEAGDSLMIKIGEAAKTLAARGLEAPDGANWSDAAKNRQKLAHHYSITDRDVTWQTLSVSRLEWAVALASLFVGALATLDLGAESGDQSGVHDPS